MTNFDKTLQSFQQHSMNKMGRLKIYLGMASGVGKTYTMLSDALIEKKRGVEIIVGYIEPHGREETESLAANFEIILPKKFNYQGIEVKEFDLDAALTRQPKIILVDELAHTNITGSRHVKRWQDIEELLKAGISVHTTLNVQHIESLRDVIAKTTSIVVKETVPDSIIAQADEIELVDISPEELIQRIKDGKVYISEKIDQALTNFFKQKNLIALRELVLRYTAERVDAQMRQYQGENLSDHIELASNRIMVCVGPTLFAQHLVRSAKRLAISLHSSLIAVCILNPRYAYFSREQQEQVNQALQLAEKLGAEVIMQSAVDIPSEIIRIAREKNVSTVIVGKPIKPRWRDLIFPSLVNEIIRQSGEIDVLVVTYNEDRAQRIPIADKSIRFSYQSVFKTGLITLFVTGICELMRPWFDLSNLIMIYLASVAWVASRYGRTEAITASILSVLAFDFFFVPPRLTFAVNDAQYIFTFVVMAVIGLLISSLTLRIKAQAQIVNDRERRTTALYNLTRQLGTAISCEEVVKISINYLNMIFQKDVACMFAKDDGTLIEEGHSRSGFEKDTHEKGVIQWVYSMGTEAGAGTDTLPASKGFYLPLKSSRESVGVLGMQLEQQLMDLDQQNLLRAFAVQIATAFERIAAEENSKETTLIIEQEKLKTSLLSSVSHDLRTPLASIAGAASVLRDNDKLTPNTRKDLADTICEQADRLTRMTRNVLDITKLGSGVVEPHYDWYALEEIVASAVEQTSSLLGPREIKIDIPAEFPLLKVDGVLLEQLFVNLLENISRYTLVTSRVWINVRIVRNTVEIFVEDDGPGLPLGEEERIFERLYRPLGTKEGGFGLGLSICKAIAKLNGGDITSANRSGGGAKFIITLPITEKAPEIINE